MLDRKLIIAIFGLLLFGACGEAAQHSLGLADAEAAGIIMPQSVHFETSDSQDFQMIEATRQDITTNAVLTAQLVFPMEQHLHFQAQEGSLTLLVENGQIVREGDVLARLTFEVDARLEIEYSAARLRFEQFEAEFMREQSERLTAIEEARQEALPELALLEIGLERFVFNGNITRNTMRNEMTMLSEMLQGEDIIAPFDGMIISAIGGPYNLRWNPRIMTIVDYTVFFYQFTIATDHPVMNLYNTIGQGDIITLRSNERHEVDGVEQPVLEFDARVVTDSWASGARRSFIYWLTPVDMEGLLEDARLLDEENPLYNMFDMSFTAQIEIVRAANSITLPNAAVNDEDRRSFVHIYNDGRLGKRYVETGVRGAGYVQIISGLEDGAQVVILP